MGVKILWGSQTGVSEEIAKQIYERCSKQNINSSLYSMQQYEEINFEEKNILIIVVSSTGEGDPPDNALKFMRYLRTLRRKIEEANKNNEEVVLPFRKLKMAILGLGDTNYTSFQGNPRLLHRSLLLLGATDFYQRAEVDEVLGLEDQVEEWIGGLWSNLATTIIDQEKEDEVEEIKKEENNIVEETKNEEVKKEEENNNQKLDENNQKESEVNEEIKKEENNIVEENKKEEVKKEEVKPKKKFVFKKKGTTKSPANDNKNESDDGKPQIKQIKPAPLPEIRITTKIMEEGSLGDYSSNLIPLQFDDVHSFRSNIKSARWLTEEEAVKQVVEITLDLSLMHRHNDHSLFEAGDSIAIHSPNPPELVNNLIERLKYAAGKVIKIDEEYEKNAPMETIPKLIQSITPCRIEDVFKWCCDLHSLPKKTFLRMLAEYTSDPHEKESLLLLSSLSGKNEYRKEIEEGAPSLLDLLEKYKTCCPPLDHLLSCLSPLQPRYYSFASSPLTGEAKIAYSIVEYQSLFSQQYRQGLCTSWLTEICLQFNLLSPRKQFVIKELNFQQVENDIVLVNRPNSNLHFHLPKDETENNYNKPIIMIGPGTGVAPFIGFLQEKKLSQTRHFGDFWLFFGCRNEKFDFIYRQELTEFVNENVLAKLVVAFSRDNPDEIVYVQDKMLELSKEIFHLIFDLHALVYICGDAKGMAKGVNNSLIKIFQENGQEDAIKILAELTNKKQIIYDVWA